MLSKNIKETSRIAKMFLEKIMKEKKSKTGATVVGLSGDLGAGKTAFAKATAKHLGVRRKVNSPTFIIIKKYPLKRKKHKFLFHIDAYRLKNEKELLPLGWEEIIGNKEHLVFIEWPELVRRAMPPHARMISIIAGKKGFRNIRLK
jgi:tRNA threonylcarbamoyladenosine biosynthesis protein TsaE